MNRNAELSGDRHRNNLRTGGQDLKSWGPDDPGLGNSASRLMSQRDTVRKITAASGQECPPRGLGGISCQAYGADATLQMTSTQTQTVTEEERGHTEDSIHTAVQCSIWGGGKLHSQDGSCLVGGMELWWGGVRPGWWLFSL